MLIRTELIKKKCELAFVELVIIKKERVNFFTPATDFGLVVGKKVAGTSIS